ncbi:MAG TPA: hypothetical protein VIV11_06175 [Kofleriaceae bacterium]
MDRHDIDALLIGALYGELTPADEARLSAHLDSHPTDRGALDDLKSARQAVRESRIFELQLDPPQAVSALLLQEAHRRAPKRVVVREEEKESWFYRFTRTFMAHPAMAAAAMLVLVVGVASMLYVKKGEDAFVEQVEAPTTKNEAPPPADPAIAPNTTTETIGADQGGLAEGSRGSSFAVGLHDKADDQENDLAKAAPSTRDRSVDNLKEQKNALERQDAYRREDTKKKTASGSIRVDTPRPQPKELPSKAGAKGDSSADFDFKSDPVVGGATTTGTFSAAPSGGGGAGAASSGRAPGTAGPAPSTPPRVTTAPPPPAATPTAPVAQAPAKPTSPTSKQSVTKEAEKTEAKPADAAPAKDSNLIAWAKGEHNRTRSLVAKGDCIAAAKIAVNISNRAPEYFSQNVSTDIALKKCQRYIAEARDAEAERSGKARSQKRVNADEPAAESTK